MGSRYRSSAKSSAFVLKTYDSEIPISKIQEFYKCIFDKFLLKVYLLVKNIVYIFKILENLKYF